MKLVCAWTVRLLLVPFVGLLLLAVSVWELVLCADEWASGVILKDRDGRGERRENVTRV